MALCDKWVALKIVEFVSIPHKSATTLIDNISHGYLVNIAFPRLSLDLFLVLTIKLVR